MLHVELINYKHTLKMCKIDCFSTATIITGMHLNVTFTLYYVSCYFIQMLFVTSDDMRSEMKLEFAELTLSYIAVLSCYDTEV